MFQWLAQESVHLIRFLCLQLNLFQRALQLCGWQSFTPALSETRASDVVTLVQDLWSLAALVLLGEQLMNNI